MRTFEFRIDYPKSKAGKTAWNRRYGLNAYYAGKHWAVRQKDAEYWHTITRAAVRECIKKPVILDNPVVIEAYFNPNEKPEALLRYLIRTYTDVGDMVLDNTMGSGSTCVAAAIEGRRYIGIEMDDKYYDIACARVAEAERQVRIDTETT